MACAITSGVSKPYFGNTVGADAAMPSMRPGTCWSPCGQRVFRAVRRSVMLLPQDQHSESEPHDKRTDGHQYLLDSGHVIHPATPIGPCVHRNLKRSPSLISISRSAAISSPTIMHCMASEMMPGTV